GGAHEALVEARAAGKLRFIGFTGHKHPSVHLHMLEVAAAHDFVFDTVQMPLNLLDAHYRSFELRVLPYLVEHGIGVLGMKSMGDGNLLRSGVVTPLECLHYALGLPTSVVITGVESLELLDQAIEAVRTFRPLTDDERAALLARTADAAATGEFEPFKTTTLFDGTAEHPEWLGAEVEPGAAVGP
ncbi:MAG TPA: aldo/keto reductase, partial [Thermoleophilia bacterium]|nr:aldo/keto reductase [Thermoleophilia bacterium]